MSLMITRRLVSGASPLKILPAIVSCRKVWSTAPIQKVNVIG